jgi:hypothetical protein
LFLRRGNAEDVHRCCPRNFANSCGRDFMAGGTSMRVIGKINGATGKERRFPNRWSYSKNLGRRLEIGAP